MPVATCRAAPALAIEEEHKLLCEPACAEELAAKDRVTTASGLQYQDLRVGTGPSPLVGFQVGDGKLLCCWGVALQLGDELRAGVFPGR